MFSFAFKVNTVILLKIGKILYQSFNAVNENSVDGIRYVDLYARYSGHLPVKSGAVETQTSSSSNNNNNNNLNNKNKFPDNN